MRAVILAATLALPAVLWGSFALGQTPGANAAPEQRAACTLEPVQTQDELVVAFVPGGETLANVLLSETNPSSILYVEVAPGQKPIDVFLITTSPAIYDFTGDVERVRRVVVGPNTAAVRGIAAARVEFPNLRDCHLPYSRGHYGGETREERWSALAVMFGRAPDREIEVTSADRLGLPDGIITSRRDEANQARRRRSGEERALYDQFPAGFRELDPASLVSPVKVLHPTTFPAQAGLIQLLQRGDIRPATMEETTRWIDGASQAYRNKFSPNFRLTISFDYSVLRPVELPAGIGKNYLVLAGVTNPAGNAKPPQGCIAYMDGFRISDDQFCFREDSDIRELRKLMTVDDRGACRVLSAPTDAAIEAVSIHNATGGQILGGQDPAELPVVVRVHRSGDVVLVLHTYDSVVWRVSLGPRTRVAGVLLIGWDEGSKVEGLPTDTPIVAIGSSSRPKLRDCEPFTAVVGEAYRGGPAAMALDREVRAWTGRGLDDIRGAPRLSEIDIP
ncbi:hypothetical protein ACVIGB_005242 [Bradyrhizobium sp. USDA 4341]